MKSQSQDSSSRDKSTADPSETPPLGRRSRWWYPDLGWALATAALTSILLIPVLRLWRANFGVPLTSEYDATFYLLLIKGVLEHGWYLENPDIGAPFGLDLYDFPLEADNFQFLVLKLLGVFSSNPAIVYNAYFLLSFPLVALAAFLVLRWLRVSGGVAAVCSVIYAFAPYHFAHQNHLFLAAYYSVPVGAYLALSLFSGEQLFDRRNRPGSRALAWVSKRSLFTLALCALVASTGVYYAVFTMMLLVAATVINFVARRDPRMLLKGGVLVGTIVVVLTFNMMPTLAYWFAHGRNDAVAQRQPERSEVAGLKLIDLVLPVPEHHIAILSDLTHRYSESTPFTTAGGAALGLVGTLGFAWLLLVALVSCISPGWKTDDGRYRWAAAATVVAFLIGTVGGISALFAYLVSSEIRGWNRLTIVIAFFAIVAVALLLDALRKRLQRRRDRPVLVGALLLGVLLVALYDQSSVAYVPDYAAEKSNFESDAAFVEKIDRALPPQAEILQLPYIAFPEGSHTMAYDLARPYLQQSDLRWSYGAIKGRPANWQADLVDEPTKILAKAASASGFEGIYIDRSGYPDRAARLEDELSKLLEAEPIVSPNGRMSFFSLSSYTERLKKRYSTEELAALRSATLRPVSVVFGEGFSEITQGVKGTLLSMKQEGHVIMTNPSGEPTTVLVEMTIEANTSKVSTVTARFPNGETERLELGDEAVDLRREIRLHPGTNVMTLSVDTSQESDDSRDEVALRISDPLIEESAYFPFHPTR